jgi:hypothetical protein
MSWSSDGTWISIYSIMLTLLTLAWAFLPA